MISTAGSLIEAVEALKKKGVVEVYAAVSHGILSGKAIERLRAGRKLKELDGK